VALLLFSGFFPLFEARLIKRRIEGIEIPLIQLVGQQAQAFSEPLIVHDLACPEKADRVPDVVVVAEAEDVVVSRPCFLLRKGCRNAA